MLVNSMSMADNRAIMKRNSVVPNNVNFKSSKFMANVISRTNNFLGDTGQKQKTGILPKMNLMLQELKYNLGFSKPINAIYDSEKKHVLLEKFKYGASKKYNYIDFGKGTSRYWYVEEEVLPSGTIIRRIPVYKNGSANHPEALISAKGVNIIAYTSEIIYPNGEIYKFDSKGNCIYKKTAKGKEYFYNTKGKPWKTFYNQAELKKRNLV